MTQPKDLPTRCEVLVLGAGENSIRLCPPLVITRDQAAARIRSIAPIEPSPT